MSYAYNHLINNTYHKFNYTDKTAVNILRDTTQSHLSGYSGGRSYTYHYFISNYWKLVYTGKNLVNTERFQIGVVSR